MSIVLNISRNEFLKFENHMEPYEEKEVQTHFLILINWIFAVNFSQHIYLD